ncbi:piggyBac transposable element-derived protein 3-like [Penaeus indicus]|uniref:piggyBac transposable element-derived protein 3-like n=1 Tax=Penaeus indicus TaxID=29960 RepID=UPI00300CBB05
MAARKDLNEESFLKLLEDLPSDYDSDTDVEEDIDDPEFEDDLTQFSHNTVSIDPLLRAQRESEEATANYELIATHLEHPTSDKEGHPSTSYQCQHDRRRWRKKPEAAQNVEFQPNSMNENSYSSALHAFLQFFDEDTISNIVYQTNLYSVQKGRAISLSKDEFYVFLGINIVMGYHKLPGLHHYWATAEDLGVRPIREAMARDRFMSILSKLHLNDNSKMNPNNKDKLYKLRPLIENLNRIFLDIRSPGEQLSVDESMIRFKGRCSFKQYNPMKAIKRGYKMWCLADNAGYIFKFDIYTGKGGDTEPNLRKEYGLGGEVVLKLTDHLRGKNHKVFFDNFFTSFALLEVLQSFRIQACGTIRPTRKDFPCLAGDKELKRGDFDYRSTPNGIIAYKWKDN